MNETEIQTVFNQAGAGEFVGVANYNCPGQIVITGSVAGVAKAVELIIAQGKKAIPLPVSGAFHSPLMDSAAHKLAGIISQQVFGPPSIPVVPNVTAEYNYSGEILRSNLTQQMLSPVLWEASVRTMLRKGITCFIEAGTGKVLSGMIKRIDRQAITLNVENIASLNSTIQTVKEKNLCS